MCLQYSRLKGTVSKMSLFYLQVYISKDGAPIDDKRHSFTTTVLLGEDKVHVEQHRSSSYAKINVKDIHLCQRTLPYQCNVHGGRFLQELHAVPWKYSTTHCIPSLYYVAKNSKFFSIHVRIMLFKMKYFDEFYIKLKNLCH